MPWHEAVGRAVVAERKRLLIRETNYRRGLVGLPPVRSEAKEKGEGGRK